MYHSGNVFGNFNSWWDRHEIKYSSLNIDKTQFQEFPLKKGFSKGDIVFIVGTKPEKLEVGDIIIFESDQKNPVIHRIIEIRQENGKYIFSTIGDNNYGQISGEKSISEDQLVGKAAANILPSVGWIKLIFYEHLRTPSERGMCNEN